MAGTSHYRASERALLTELGDGTGVLLDLDSKFYFTLNETAIFVWKQLAAPEPIDCSELAQRLAREYAVDRTEAERDVAEVLDVLARERLVSTGA